MEKGYNDIKMMFDALDNIDKRKIQEAMDKDSQSTDGISYTQNDEIMTNWKLVKHSSVLILQSIMILAQ